MSGCGGRRVLASGRREKWSRSRAGIIPGSSSYAGGIFVAFSRASPRSGVGAGSPAQSLLSQRDTELAPFSYAPFAERA